ncbi:MAG: carbohydrate ABC transporter permease, partial [Brachybacterium sp.]|nr:carbohydrate ABC transporter permease [Brachybacterium sp.]
MSTLDTTRATTTPTGRRKAPVTDGRAGSRDAGRKPTSTIIVTAILVIVALYFLVPVYWVVINATKSSEDLFGSSGFWFGESFQLVENIKAV